MIVKHIFIYPDLTAYSKAFIAGFRDRSRCVCNYAGRYLKMAKTNSGEYNKICFVGARSNPRGMFVSSSKSLIVEFLLSEPNSLCWEKYSNEYFVEKISHILRDHGQKQIPEAAAIFSALEDFKNGGNKNIWVWKRLVLEPRVSSLEIEFELTENDFIASLVVACNSKEVFRRVICKHVPDEIVFVPRFNALEVIEGKVVILNNSKRVEHEIGAINDLKKLC